jgi:hypothetical protein
MGQPDWSIIPFSKMPEWKKKEVREKEAGFRCAKCGELFNEKLALARHSKKHK